MMKNYFARGSVKPYIIFLFATLLTACGGAGDGGGGSATNQVQVVAPPAIIPTVSFLSTSSSETTRLGFVGIDTSNSAFDGFAGTLNQEAGSITGGWLAGIINEERTRINISGGGSATLTALENTAYSRAFSTSGQSNDLFGVVGQSTVLAEMPEIGSSIYSGRVILQADNGDATFALSGSAMVTVGWVATNDVDSVFGDLGGRKNDTQDVSNIGTVTINNATLSGSTFSGGTINTSGSDLAYSGGGQSVHEAQFFGPNAAEVGGVFGLTSSELALSGVFSAKR